MNPHYPYVRCVDPVNGLLKLARRIASGVVLVTSLLSTNQRLLAGSPDGTLAGRVDRRCTGRNRGP